MTTKSISLNDAEPRPHSRFYLGAKLSLVLTIAISIVAFAYFSLAIYQSYVRIRSALESQATLIGDMQSKALVPSLWNFDLEAAKRILSATFHDPDFLGASLKNDAGVTILELGTPSADVGAWNIKRAIKYQDGDRETSLGELALWFSDRSIRAAFREQVITSGIAYVSLVLILVLITTISTSLMTSPLTTIAEAMRDFAAGKADSKLKNFNPSSVEIQKLFESFISMKTEIEHFQKTLEGKVEARTVELVEAKLEAEAANEAKGKFLAVMSHEIRTPINGVLGYSQAILNIVQDDSVREHLAALMDCARTLLDLINDLLDLSKIESRNCILEKIPIDLRGLLQEVHSVNRVRAQDKNLSFKLDIAENLPRTILGDPTRLKQVLLNLTSNAIKFTERGGVTLIAKSCASNRIQLVVVDTGCGIEASKHKIIFEPFMQADQSTTRTHGGTGLGLNIAKQLTQLMGGSLSLQSELSKGSIFTIDLPVEVSSIPAMQDRYAQQTETSTQGPARALRVLLVDDVASNRAVTRLLLEQRGHTVLTSSNGMEAIEVLKKQWASQTSSSGVIDIVLMDVEMPGLDGLETTRLIRKYESEFCGGSARTPILAFSANSSSGDVANAVSAGMDGFVEKPVIASKLFHTLESHGRLNYLLPAVHEVPLEDTVLQSADSTFIVQLLRKLHGNKAAAIEIATDVLDEMNTFIPNIQAAILIQNFEGIARNAHALKSSLSSISAVRGCELASSLEHLGRKGDVGEAKIVLGELLEEVRVLEANLTTFISAG